MSVDIDCKDIYNAINTGVKNMPGDGGSIARNIWDTLPTNVPCTKNTSLGTSICGFVGLAATGSSGAIAELKKNNLTWAEIDPYCEDIFNKCQPTFCSAGATDARLDIPCKAIQSITSLLFKDHVIVALLKANEPAIKKALNKTVDLSSEKAICEQLIALGLGASELATVIVGIVGTMNKVPESVSKFVGKSKTQITNLLLCMCPDLAHIAPDPSHVKTDVVNWYIVLYLGLGALGLAVIVSIIVLFALRSPFIEKIPVFGSIFALCFIAVLIVCYANPKGLIRTHTIAGDDWKRGGGKDSAIEGQFSGRESIYTITVSAHLTIAKDGLTAKLESLCCEGQGCPQNNLLDKCKGINGTVTIDQTKTDSGYALTGPCMDAIKTIPNDNGSPVVQGAWLVRQGDDLKLQLLLHVCITSSVCLSKTLLLSLNRGGTSKTC
jgi:hypothetical protein